MIHILIVEDEKPISNLIRMSLTKAGYSCMCAYDGEQALDMIKNNVYDLILLDVMIPKIDGFSLMQYIRPMKLPVIFLTAKNMVEDRVRGLELGAEVIVYKDGYQIPLTPKEYELLLLFARNPGIAMYRETIYERVWNEPFPYGSKTVDLHIQRLRKKLGWEDVIHAVPKVGYRLEAD